ncbi:hypothetical protein HanHA300_Chr06g0203031 [Helianthus annuus]|nr:hypothetical protein HanHA300_Chr06g0203031 [Helianthus annuus]
MDAALSSNSLDAVYKDVKRQVVAMVKMLVAKSKAGMVVQVMEEFEGIYYQLNTGLRVVA